ncbi:MAG: hypothetical protein Q9220_007614 [cf. Caloplaca sp. 1 TL-2023]
MHSSDADISSSETLFSTSSDYSTERETPCPARRVRGQQATAASAIVDDEGRARVQQQDATTQTTQAFAVLDNGVLRTCVQQQEGIAPQTAAAAPTTAGGGQGETWVNIIANTLVRRFESRPWIALFGLNLPSIVGHLFGIRFFANIEGPGPFTNEVQGNLFLIYWGSVAAAWWVALFHSMWLKGRNSIGFGHTLEMFVLLLWTSFLVVVVLGERLFGDRNRDLEFGVGY